MNWWRRKRKIATLPNVRLTPVVALARTLEKAQAGRIKSVYIGIEWEEDYQGNTGVFEGEWSNMSAGSLGLHAKVAEESARREFFKGSEEDGWYTTGRA